MEGEYLDCGAMKPRPRWRPRNPLRAFIVAFHAESAAAQRFVDTGRRRLPVGCVGERLEHEAGKAIEQGKVKLNGHVAVAKIQAHVLSTAEPERQGGHVLARESKPQRIGPRQPCSSEPLHLAYGRWWVGRKANCRVRRLLLLGDPRALVRRRSPKL
eukprot:2820990-Prymnesium_polylepis.1